MYRVTIAKKMSIYFSNHIDGISFEVSDPYTVKDYVQDFSQKGFDVLVRYQPDEDKGE